jgi:hypothetical protein
MVFLRTEAVKYEVAEEGEEKALMRVLMRRAHRSTVVLLLCFLSQPPRFIKWEDFFCVSCGRDESLLLWEGPYNKNLLTLCSVMQCKVRFPSDFHKNWPLLVECRRLGVALCRYCVNWRFGWTSVYTISIRRHIPDDGILHSHRRENLKSHTLTYIYWKIFSQEPYS